jgi:hypothetical protein
MMPYRCISATMTEEPSKKNILGFSQAEQVKDPKKKKQNTPKRHKID